MMRAARATEVDSCKQKLYRTTYVNTSLFHAIHCSVPLCCTVTSLAFAIALAGKLEFEHDMAVHFHN